MPNGPRRPLHYARGVKAAAIIAEQPVAVTLRYLQTLTEIGVEQNTTIVFPLPVDILTAFQGKAKASTAS